METNGFGSGTLLASATVQNGYSPEQTTSQLSRYAMVFNDPRVWPVIVLMVALFALALAPAHAQSTAGSILGRVKDPSGSVVPGAAVTLTNTGTSATRSTVTDKEGAYNFPDVEAGAYQVSVEAKGFQKTAVTNLDEQARENKRVDVGLVVGTATITVTVEGTAAGVLTTDESALSQTKTGRELLDLPVGLTSRSQGSTSLFSALSTEPGVQAASNTSMVIAGATPALQSVTIDGISTINVGAPNGGPTPGTDSEILTELFPSVNAISEMRISESNMNAEYSSVVDVTTTTKGGGNRYHGGLGEFYESKGLNADDRFAPAKPNVVMNNFSAYASGPLSIPHLYDGHDKTFFFVDYEGLRLPQSAPVLMTVPTAAMQAGNICAYLDTAYGVTPGNEPNLFQPNGTQIPCDAVPVSSIAANVMKYLYPQPTSPTSILNNYSQNFPTSTSVNQGDLRIDHNISSKQSVFARFTYKRILSLSPPSDAVFGSTMGTEIDSGFVVADNYAFTAHLINELRIGANGTNAQGSFSVYPPALLSELGITGITNVPTVAATPIFNPGTTESSTGNGTAQAMKSHTIQVFDNLTWVRGNHTMKFGADVRRLADNFPAIDAFGTTELGNYTFNGTAAFAQTGTNPTGQTGDGFAEFLLGYPDSTLLTETTDPGMSAWAYAWAFYGQDTWHITKDLTLDFGLRYELHPPLQMHGNNATGFLPGYEATIGGVNVHGAVVAPNQQGVNIVEPAFAASIFPTPILTAAQAGLPTGLRFTDRSDFGPRFGFAWRPFHNDKTVIRGGFGRFIEPPAGGSAYFNWAIATSNNPTFAQGYNSSTGQPTLTFPDPFTGPAGGGTAVGTQNFEDAFDPHYHDPVVYQWNLTGERDLGHAVGLRVSYIGNHGAGLDYPRDLNQIAPNTTGYFANAPNRPYPLWNYIDQIFNGAESNYNSLSTVVTRRFSHGLQFQASYTFTRDLSDAAGAAPRSLATVGGAGQVGTYGADPRLDYGNVTFDRRHRFLATFVYELPFGAGKRFLAGSNALVKNIVGGWELSGILVDQSGSFLTLTESQTDPSGTGQGGLEGNYPNSRVDIVPGVSPYLSNTFKGTAPRGAPLPLYFNKAAFVDPPSNIGRFADEPVGYVTGPGQNIVSLSVLKNVQLSERAKLQIGCSAANLFNHPNYGNPNTNFSSGRFGEISSLQSNEAGGPRFLQLTGRLSF